MEERLEEFGLIEYVSHTTTQVTITVEEGTGDTVIEWLKYFFLVLI